MINLMSVKRENIMMSGMPVLPPEPDKLWSDSLPVIATTSSSLSWLIFTTEHGPCGKVFNTSEGKKIYITMN